MRPRRKPWGLLISAIWSRSCSARKGAACAGWCASVAINSHDCRPAARRRRSTSPTPPRLPFTSSSALVPTRNCPGARLVDRGWRATRSSRISLSHGSLSGPTARESPNAADPLLRSQRLLAGALCDPDRDWRAVRGAAVEFPQIAAYGARIFAAQSQAQGAGAGHRRHAADRERGHPNLDRPEFSGGEAAPRRPDAGFAGDLLAGLVRLGHPPLPV